VGTAFARRMAMRVIRCHRVIVAAVCAVFASRCGSGHGPTGLSGSVRTLTVSGAAPAVGATVPFTATATLSDGSTHDVTTTATWTSSNAAIADIVGTGLVMGIDPGDVDVAARFQNVTGSEHVTVPKPQCDASLWSHVYLPQRLRINQPCATVTGVVMEQHGNEDGDVDIRVAVDTPYAHLLNSGNMTNLDGWLQTEAICQAPIKAGQTDPLRACGSFKGSVPVPAVGTHVVVTGTYVLDTNHGWMELHPITSMVER